MSKYAKVSFELKDYAEDGETLLQYVTCECSGFDTRDVWSRMEFHGRQPSERELRLIADIGRAIEELAGSGCTA